MKHIRLLLCWVAVLWLSHMTSAIAKPWGAISYSEAGQGQPLILIHAFPTDQRLWEPQRAGLKNSFRVITLDLWGFGHSPATDGKAVAMTEYADEVKQLMDQLNIKKAIIGGESMGGYIALAFLAKYPDQVAGLILSDTQAVADSPEAKTKRETTAVNVLEHGMDQLVHDFMPKALSPAADENTRAALQGILLMQTPTGVASALRGMAGRADTSNVLANITVPVLIMTGDQDTLISPQQSQNMHALVKGSHLVVINHAGHLSSLEQPKQWNQAVKEVFSTSNKN